MSKPKLLWISDSPVLKFVGQSRVSREFIVRLQKDFDVSCIGYSHDNTPFCCEIFPSKRRDWDMFEKVVKKVKPAVIVASHDPWLFTRFPEMKIKFPEVKFVLYGTVDGWPIHSSWIPVFRACDLIMTPCQYAKDVIQQRVADIPIQVVPYGVDRNVFKPIAKTKAECKQAVFDLDLPLLQQIGINKKQTGSKTVFFFIGHNQTKKNIGAMLGAMQMCADVKKYQFALFLILHSMTAKNDANHILSGDTDIFDAVKVDRNMDHLAYREEKITDEQLNLVYNASDFFMYPSLGESPGLQVQEAASAGCIPIYTNWSGLAEVGEGVGIGLTPIAFLYGEYNVRRAVISSATLAKAMQMCIELPVERKEKLFSNAVNAVLPTWDMSAVLMKELLQAVTSSQKIADTDVEDIGSWTEKRFSQWSTEPVQI